MTKKPQLISSKLVPKFVRSRINRQRTNQTIIKHYEALPHTSVSLEETAALNYLKQHGLQVFPYRFTEKYKKEEVQVYDDKALQLKYVIFEGKKLYFKRKSSARGIKRNYSRLLAEQDEASPHRYLTLDFDIQENDILVDVGAAEGNLPLEVIEKVSKVYLFETDPRWIEALEATFAPWKDKVEIVNKFVSNTNDEKHVSLDAFFKDRPAPTFIKVDAEGAEADILTGATQLLHSDQPLRLALCCYHKPNDAVEFDERLSALGFSNAFAKGYMVFPEIATFSPPYLRRGVLRATRS